MMEVVAVEVLMAADAGLEAGMCARVMARIRTTARGGEVARATRVTRPE